MNGEKSDKKKSFKKAWIAVFKIALAVILIWYLLNNDILDISVIGKFTRLENAPFFLLAILAFFVSQIGMAARMKLLLKGIDYHISFGKSFGLTLMGSFYNFILIGSVGGDFIKGYFLFREKREEKGRSLAIIVLDRVIGLVGLIFVALIGLIAVFIIDDEAFAEHRWAVVLFSVTMCLVLVLFYILTRFGSHPTVRSIISNTLLKRFGANYIYSVFQGFGALIKDYGTVFQAIAISFGVHLSSLFGIISLVAIFIDLEPIETLRLATVSAVVTLMGAVPVTPGNLGWIELVADISWNLVGSSHGAEVFLMWRLVCIITALPGGVYKLYGFGSNTITPNGKNEERS